MKTALISALAISAALTGAAVAQQVPAGAAGAVAHFNQSIDDANARADLSVAGDEGTTVSTRSGSLGTAFGIFNADVDNANERTGLNGATVVSGEATYGAEIFRQLDAE